MRRHKVQTQQINVRLDRAIIDQLEARAKTARHSFAEETRQRIIMSFVARPELSLAEFRESWTRRVRETIVDEVRKDNAAAVNIEADLRNLQALDAAWAHFYGDMEIKLQSYVKYPKIRELLRGAPAALDGE